MVLVVVGGIVVVVVLVVVVVVVLVVVVVVLVVDGGLLEEVAADGGTDEGILGCDVVLGGELADGELSGDELADDGSSDVLLVSDASESELPPPQAAAARATDNAAPSSLICSFICALLYPLRVLIISSYLLQSCQETATTKIRRRPTLPRRFRLSTIGAGGLNFRVRDGNGCDPTAMVTEKL